MESIFYPQVLTNSRIGILNYFTPRSCLSQHSRQRLKRPQIFRVFQPQPLIKLSQKYPKKSRKVQLIPSLLVILQMQSSVMVVHWLSKQGKMEKGIRLWRMLKICIRRVVRAIGIRLRTSRTTHRSDTVDQEVLGLLELWNDAG